jgi:hypothetical protein
MDDARCSCLSMIADQLVRRYGSTGQGEFPQPRPSRLAQSPMTSDLNRGAYGGETVMNKPAGLLSALAAVVVVVVGWAAAPALARPPTVGVNPGYDRRLIESRKALAGPDAAAAPVTHHKHRRYRQ